jgi:hypothetical protein
MDARISVLSKSLVALVSAAVLLVAGYWVVKANAAETKGAAGGSITYPDWFLPIWDAYGRNPAVTPDFDFASLYSADIGEAASGSAHGGAGRRR